MALRTNAILTFVGYTVRDDGTQLHFTCANPGAGENSDYYVLATDADLATVTSAATFTNLVQTKLNRLIRASGIASKLDARIGTQLTV